MSPFAQSNVACATLNILRAMELLAKHTETDLPDPRLVSAAYAELLDAKGHLTAAAQLEEMQRIAEEGRIQAAQRELGVADTERPVRRMRLVTE